ncbi:MAG: FAD-dependent oxidoreductase [Deltaproteobacteria bacterium]|nr:FAD-dependent oxidoreductase [Deltaproteobacteria bacterium]
MSRDTLRDLIIIGGGPAGLTAALYAGRARIDTELLEACVPGGEMSMRDLVEVYPGFPDGISGFELGELMRRQAEAYGSVLTSAKALSLEFDGHSWVVHCEGTDYRARAVIVATGESYKKLNVPGEEDLAGKGVAYCAVKEGSLFRDKAVAVIGSNNIALETVEFLSRIGTSITLLYQGESMKAEKVLQERVLANPKVQVKMANRVLSIHGTDSVERVHCFDQARGVEWDLDVRGVFILVGWQPNSGIVKNLAEIDEEGYIKADETTVTGLPGLFAAGDIRTKALRRPTTAVSDGAVAAFMVQSYLEGLKQPEDK